MSTKTKDLRQLAIAKLGGKCKICGFDDIRALQIDHVNSDGFAERKLLTQQGIYYSAIFDTEGRYQLLCANCNTIKRIKNGEHQTRRVTSDLVKYIKDFERAQFEDELEKELWLLHQEFDVEGSK